MESRIKNLNKSSISRLHSIASMIQSTPIKKRYAYPVLGFEMKKTSPNRLMIRWSTPKDRSSNNKTVIVVLESRSAFRNFAKSEWTMDAPDSSTPGSKSSVSDMTAALIELLGGSVNTRPKLPNNVLSEVAKHIKSPQNLIRFASSSKRTQKASKDAINKMKKCIMDLLKRFRNGNLFDGDALEMTDKNLLNKPTDSPEEKRRKMQVRRFLGTFSNLDYPLTVHFMDSLIGLGADRVYGLFIESQKIRSTNNLNKFSETIESHPYYLQRDFNWL